MYIKMSVLTSQEIFQMTHTKGQEEINIYSRENKSNTWNDLTLCFDTINNCICLNNITINNQIQWLKCLSFVMLNRGERKWLIMSY